MLYKSKSCMPIRWGERESQTQKKRIKSVLICKEQQ